MKARNALVILACGWYGVLWLGGVGTYLLADQPPPHVAWAAPAFLCTATFLVLLTSHRVEAVALLVCGALGWAAEVVGVHTGFPFGGYAYTTVLGPGLLGVPFTMVCAWLLLVAYGRAMAAVFGLPGLVGMAGGAGWMVAMDMVIDPLAGGALAYWTWEVDGSYYGIPASNFLGWFAVSAVLLALMMPVRRLSPHHGTVGLSLLLFFTILAAARGLVLASLVGVVLVAAHVAGGLRLRRSRQCP